MIFALLDSKIFPCPRTHNLHLRKFSFGFIQNGYQTITIKNENDLSKLSENDIVYVSNHFSVDLFHRPFKRIIQKKLIQILEKSRCKVIFWNFHTCHDIKALQNFKTRAVFLTENFYSGYEQNENTLKEMMQNFDVKKLKYSSTTLNKPNFKKNRKYQLQFVGSRYKTDILNKASKKFKSYIKFAPPIQDEITRVNSFSNSIICIVFHSDDNIRKGIIVERFPEALSAPSIIIHDHPRINAEYNSSGLYYVENEDEFFSSVDKVLNKNNYELEELYMQNWEEYKKSDLKYYDQAKIILKELGLK